MLARIKVLALLLALGSPALGADTRLSPPRLPPGVTCEDVRTHVRRWGKLVALAWAKAQGFSRVEIREAQRCL